MDILIILLAFAVFQLINVMFWGTIPPIAVSCVTWYVAGKRYRVAQERADAALKEARSIANTVEHQVQGMETRIEDIKELIPDEKRIIKSVLDVIPTKQALTKMTTDAINGLLGKKVQQGVDDMKKGVNGAVDQLTGQGAPLLINGEAPTAAEVLTSTIIHKIMDKVGEM